MSARLTQLITLVFNPRIGGSIPAFCVISPYLYVCLTFDSKHILWDKKSSTGGEINHHCFKYPGSPDLWTGRLEMAYKELKSA